MSTFGKLLRFYRRQSRDPDRGGMLTQARFGELIGLELGDAGYAGAAISYWEQDKTKINEDDRLVLISLISVLHQCSGLSSLKQANDLLRAGNYRALNIEETGRVFPDAIVVSSDAGYPSKALLKADPQDIGDQQAPYLQTTEPRSTSIDRQRRRKQLILLNKVNHFWVEGVLEHSTRDAKLIDLTWEPQSEVVQQPWEGIIDSVAYSQLQQSDAANIGVVFDRCVRSLLILGSPGAGKTTLLLMLARYLIERAREDSNQPIPVILSLVSWEASRGPLADWIVDELTAKYQIPRQLGRNWLENDQLVLLLDGYDEVRDGRRQECAEEINHFRQTQGLTGIAVCSRTERYEAVSLKLNLCTAIVIDPLTAEQVDDYLAAAGSRLNVLRGTMETERSLREMARTPLMLSVMGAAYSDVSGTRLGDVSDSEVTPGKSTKTGTGQRRNIGRQNKLFEAYIRRMFDRYGGDPAYPSGLTVNYLSWLARKLPQHNMSVFLIEQMQPCWLPTLRWRRLYMLFHGLVVGLVAGVILSLLLIILDLDMNRSGLTLQLFGPVVDFIFIPTTFGLFLLLIAGNLLLGIVTSAISAYHMERYEMRKVEGTSTNRLKWQRVLITGTIVGFLSVILFLPFSEPQLAVAWSVAEIVVYVVVARYVHGQSYDSDIRVVESISWSWQHALKGLLLGLLLGFMTEVVGAMVAGTVSGRTVLVFMLGGFLLSGMQGRRVEEKSRPNEGILLSIRNAYVAAAVTGPILGLLVLILYDWRHGLLTALVMILVVFSLFGGSTVTKHLLLRTLLRGERHTPWRYARFLDHACWLVFLRKVGGGYIFMHRSLQDYFAALVTIPPSHPLQEESFPDFIIRDTLPGTNL